MAPDPQIGRQLGHYRIVDVVGRGGMGIVYLAEQAQLERRVALKIVAEELGADAGFRARFIREAQLAASLEHPNIIPIYDAGEEGETLYLAMRYVRGSDLSARIAEGPLAAERAVELLRPIADALDVAHAAGLIHRDIKPANILIAGGPREQVFLTDFGLAKRMDSASRITVTGMVVGTLSYLAPEQLRGERLDGRADQYALGCVVFEALTGNPPFTGEIEAHIMFAHLTEPPPAPSATRPEIPPGVDAAVQRAMAKNPADRFASCSDLIEAMRTAMPAAPSQTRMSAWTPPGAPVPPRFPPPAAPAPGSVVAPAGAAVPVVVSPERPEPRPQRSRRGRTVLIALASLLLVGGGVAAVVLLGGGSPSPTRPRGLAISWQRVTAPALQGAGIQEIHDVTPGSPTLIAVGTVPGAGGTGASAVWTSPDGVRWLPATLVGKTKGALNGVWPRLAGRTPHLVAVGARGSDAVSWTSETGDSWVSSGTGLGGHGSQEADDVIGGVTGLLAVGTSNGDAAVWRSANATDWGRVSVRALARAGAQSMSGAVRVLPGTSVSDGLYAVGTDRGRMAAWYSAEGSSWRELTLPAGASFAGGAASVAFVPSGPKQRTVQPALVAVGNRGSRAAAWISTDGQTWSASSAVAGRAAHQTMNDVVSLDQGLVAVGTDGDEGAVWSSLDGGRHWIEAPSAPDVFSGTGPQAMLAVTLGDRGLVGVGSGGPSGEQDGVVWTGTSVRGLTRPSESPPPTSQPPTSIPPTTNGVTTPPTTHAATSAPATTPCVVPDLAVVSLDSSSVTVANEANCDAGPFTVTVGPEGSTPDTEHREALAANSQEVVTYPGGCGAGLSARFDATVSLDSGPDADPSNDTKSSFACGTGPP
ncbi:MAG: protein kinase domain-containing protein [Actinomycetota bacterium]